MTITVRLPQTLDQALDAYCAENGFTKSHVVQECLAEYLVRVEHSATDEAAPVSANYAAFKRAGAIGTEKLGKRSATKEVVREQALARLARKQ